MPIIPRVMRTSANVNAGLRRPAKCDEKTSAKVNAIFLLNLVNATLLIVKNLNFIIATSVCDVLLHSITIIIQENKGMQEYEVMYHKIISKNIKKLRKEAKLSQESFAEKLNCSREFISRVENLKEKVSLKMILKLSEIFKISPKYFFEEN